MNAVLRHFLGRGIFPPQLAWFLEGPWRWLVLSPDTLRRRLPLTEDAVVCEIGVGGGYYGRVLAPLVRQFIGLDLQREMLRRVRRLEGGKRVALVQADATRLPVARGSVDVVVMVTVLGEVPSAEAALAEAARILRPGGVLSVSEHVPDPDYVAFGRLTKLCAEAGLQFVRRDGPAWSYTATFRRP